MSLNPAVNDPEVLESLYWHEGLSMWQIAMRLDCSETTVYRRMAEYGIDRRGAKYNSKFGQEYKKSLPFRMTNDGYEIWRTNPKTEGISSTRVHQLLAVAEGEDPSKVYGDGYDVHHKNGISWDNRPENIEVLTEQEHGKLHADKRQMAEIGRQNKEYTDQEMLDWLSLFVDELGFVPTDSDIKGWPGPTAESYRYRFGSFTRAIEEAGHTPRSKQ